MTFSYQSFVVKAIILSSGSRGGAQGARPSPNVSTKLRPERPKKIFLETGLPPYLRVWMTAAPPPPPPLSEGLDPPLILSINFNFNFQLYLFKFENIAKDTYRCDGLLIVNSFQCVSSFQKQNCHHASFSLDVSKTIPNLSASVERYQISQHWYQ